MVKKQIKLKSSLFEDSKAVLTLFLMLLLLGVGFLWWKNYINQAATVNGEVVSRTEFQDNVNALVLYQQQQKIDVSTSEKLKEVRNDVLDELIRNEVIRQEAQKRGITVTGQDIDAQYTKVANANAGEDKFREQIKTLYGFSVEQYKQYKITPSLYRIRLEESLKSDENYKKEAKDKINSANDELKSGASFESVAAKYSEDQFSKDNGGDIGYVKRGEQVKEYEDVAFSLEKGSVSQVLETKQGYYIIKVTDKRGDEVKISQVFVSIKSFDAWVSDMIKEADISLLVRY